MRREFGVWIRGLVALLVAAVSLTLFPSGPLQAQSTGGTWTTKAPMPTARLFHGVAAAGSKVYAVGGSNNDGFFFSTVEGYDPATNTWVTKAPMPTAREELGLAGANGKIYAIGGSFSGTALTTVEEYDPATNSWASKAPMPTARVSLAVASAANGKIYAIGGFNFSGGALTTLGTVEEYDPATNSWATKAPMPSPRNSLAAATATNGKIYAIGGGGHGIVGTVEEYDPASNIWASKSPLPTARAFLGAAAAANGKLYAIGGLNSTETGFLATVEEYDPAANAWATSAPMSSARVDLGVAAATNGKLYAIGGCLDLDCPTARTEELDPPTPSADLAVSQTDTPDPLAVGNALTYTIAVRNNGPLSATGVMLTDTLPSGVSFVSASASQGSCSGTTTLTCTLGSLANGGTVTVTISVKPTAAGPLTNTATVAGSVPDPVSANNTSTEGTTVLTTADLSRLTVAVQGQGRVTSNPSGIDCHPGCQANFGPGATVSLTAVPLTGWRFDHWERACQGQASTCNLTLGSDLLVKAVFVRAP